MSPEPSRAVPQQSYETHRHTPRLTVVGALFALGALVCFGVAALGYGGVALGLILLTFAVLVLLVISRVYITALQDRIIRLEMRVRCNELLPETTLEEFDRLTKGQIVALRFASDRELPALYERALRESLSADQIKRAIAEWRPDLART